MTDLNEQSDDPATKASQVVEVEEAPAWIIKNCVLPSNLLYDVERDMWAAVNSQTGLVRIGLTDVGQTAGGKLQTVSFPNVDRRLGNVVPANKTLALLESAKWLGPVRLEVAARLVAVNTALLEHPLWVNLEPYRNGWVIACYPESPLPWLAGEEARMAYSIRLRRTFRSVAGVNDDFWCIHCNDWDDL